MGIFQNAYQASCAAHNFESDAAQLDFLTHVDTLWGPQKRSWTDLLHLTTPPKQPSGFYVYGCVGRGKTMLMRLIFQTLPSEKKCFMHFADFMIYVHRLLYDHAHASMQPIECVIKHLSTEMTHLFLDEFQVLEIADAMILSRLFSGLLTKGVKVMITSNLSPDELYKGGLHYDRFAPFVDTLKAKMIVYGLENCSLTDYRTRITAPKKTVFLSNSESEAAMSLWKNVAQGQPVPVKLMINDRPLLLENVCENSAAFTFQKLCSNAMSGEDYIALSDIFDIFFIQSIPILTGSVPNEARRFITLIDVLYSRHKKVILTVETPLEKIWDPVTLPLPFERTLSRLKEMQSEAYWNHGN